MFSVFYNEQVLWNSHDKKVTFFFLKYDGDKDFVAAKELLRISCKMQKPRFKNCIYTITTQKHKRVEEIHQTFKSNNYSFFYIFGNMALVINYINNNTYLKCLSFLSIRLK